MLQCSCLHDLVLVNELDDKESKVPCEVKKMTLKIKVNQKDVCVAIFVSELNDTVSSEFLLLSSFIYCERTF